MNDELKPLFDHLRTTERDAAPAWHPRHLRAPEPRRVLAAPRVAFASVLACVAAFWLLRPAQPGVADLPPLFDSAPGGLFASLDAPSSDFLLPSHLTIHMP